MPLNCFAKSPLDKKRKTIFNKALTTKLKQLRDMFANFNIVRDERVDSAEIDIEVKGNVEDLLNNLMACGINKFSVTKNKVTIAIQNINSSDEDIPLALNELFLDDKDFQNLLSGIVSEFIRKDNTGKNYVHNEDYAKESVDKAFGFEYLNRAQDILKRNKGILRIKTPSVSDVRNKMADKFTELWYKMGLK